MKLRLPAKAFVPAIVLSALLIAGCTDMRATGTAGGGSSAGDVHGRIGVKVPMLTNDHRP